MPMLPRVTLALEMPDLSVVPHATPTKLSAPHPTSAVMSITRSTLAVFAIAVLGAAGGCVELRQFTCDCVTRMQACSAYRHSACSPDCSEGRRHYARGWKQGYFDVAQGSDGCAPALPPDRYLSCLYQSCEGEADIRAWYSGYQDGAHAALACGVQEHNFIHSPACASAVPCQPQIYDAQQEQETVEAEAEALPEPQVMHEAEPMDSAGIDRLPPLRLVASDVAVPCASSVAAECGRTEIPRGSTAPANVLLHKNPLRQQSLRALQTATIDQ